MRQFFADCVDQLDLAIDQLAVADRNFDRFALMLIDNVVELTMHRFAEEKARSNTWSGRAPKYAPELVAKALSQSFDTKAKAARDLGLFNAKVCDAVLQLHRFRNTAYHRGLRHEGILHSLAAFYYQNACDILKAHVPNSWVSSSVDRISHRAMKYLGHKDSVISYLDTTVQACGRLKELVNVLQCDLVGDLAADMQSTIDVVEEGLDFLERDGPKDLSRDEVVQECQLYAVAYSDEGKRFAREKGWHPE
jgi:hypothetical protein